jgi:hypothetical protein
MTGTSVTPIGLHVIATGICIRYMYSSHKVHDMLLNYHMSCMSKSKCYPVTLSTNNDVSNCVVCELC